MLSVGLLGRRGEGEVGAWPQRKIMEGKLGERNGGNWGVRKAAIQANGSKEIKWRTYRVYFFGSSRQRQLGMEGVKWREKREKYKNTGRESNPFLNTSVMAAERPSLVTIIPGKTVYGKSPGLPLATSQLVCWHGGNQEYTFRMVTYTPCFWPSNGC